MKYMVLLFIIDVFDLGLVVVFTTLLFTEALFELGACVLVVVVIASSGRFDMILFDLLIGFV